LRRYPDFCDFRHSGRRHLGFQKFEILTVCSLYGANLRQRAVPNFIKIGQTVDLTVFKMAGSRHLGFLKLKFFYTKFRKDLLNRCGYVAISVIFKMAAAAVLDFQKFEVLRISPLQGLNVRHRGKFHQNRSNGCGDMAFFQNGVRPPSWILLGACLDNQRRLLLESLQYFR